MSSAFITDRSISTNISGLNKEPASVMPVAMRNRHALAWIIRSPALPSEYGLGQAAPARHIA